MKHLLASALLISLPFTAHAGSTADYKAAMEVMHRDMDIAYTGDVDTDFLRGMIPHHQGAIDMAKVVLAHGKDPDIRWLAEWIIYIQEIEIAHMQQMLNRFGADKGEKICGFHEAATHQSKQHMQHMHHAMNIAYTGDADVDFVLGMIPHHQGAIDMAYTELDYGKNPEAEQMARDIIVAQKSEIARMESWLNKRGINAADYKNHTNMNHHH